MSYANIAVTKKAGGVYLNYNNCIDAEYAQPEIETEITNIAAGDFLF